MNVVNFTDGADGLAAGVCTIAAGDVRDHRAVASTRDDGAACSRRSRRAPRSASSGTTSTPPRSSWATRARTCSGCCSPRVAIQGVLKTAAVVALFFPLLILAVPALDATFVVAKRIKYRRPVYSADRWHFHHRFANIGFSQRRTVLYLYGWTLSLAALALAMRFVPYSDDDGTPQRRLGARDRGVRRDRAGGERLPGARARDPEVPALPRARDPAPGRDRARCRRSAPSRSSTRSTARSRPASSRPSARTDARFASCDSGHANGMAEPKEEIEQLLNFLLPFAEEMLSKEGEFYPCAAMRRGGRRGHGRGQPTWATSPGRRRRCCLPARAAARAGRRGRDPRVRHRSRRDADRSRQRRDDGRRPGRARPRGRRRRRHLRALRERRRRDQVRRAGGSTRAASRFLLRAS